LRPVPYFQGGIFVLDAPLACGKSSSGWQLTSVTGVSPQLWFSQSRPHCLRRRYHRSDCDWTGVSLAPLPVIALPVATR